MALPLPTSWGCHRKTSSRGLSDLLLCRLGCRWLRGSAQQPLARRLLILAAADGKKHRVPRSCDLGKVVKVETFVEGKAKGLLGYDMILDSGGRYI